MTGEEVSPLFTHLGAYGIPYDPYGRRWCPTHTLRSDARHLDGVQIPELIDQARARGAEIIQVNHPRASQGYFDHVDYSPEIPVESLDPLEFSDDFDSVEIFNSPNKFCKNFDDWQGLLNQGLRVTAIGNSDTHSLDQAPGYPRNYMRTLAPNPVDVTGAEIADSVKAGAVTMGAGAMIDFPTGPQPGDTVSIDGDTLTLDVRIQTPSFSKIDQLIVYVNGERFSTRQ